MSRCLPDSKKENRIKKIPFKSFSFLFNTFSNAKRQRLLEWPEQSLCCPRCPKWRVGERAQTGAFRVSTCNEFVASGQQCVFCYNCSVSIIQFWGSEGLWWVLWCGYPRELVPVLTPSSFPNVPHMVSLPSLVAWTPRRFILKTIALQLLLTVIDTWAWRVPHDLWSRLCFLFRFSSWVAQLERIAILLISDIKNNWHSISTTPSTLFYNLITFFF